MQRQRGAVGSCPETLGYEHGSALSDDGNSPSDILSDYISLNVTNEDNPNEDMWNVEEPEPASNMLSLGDHGSSSSSFSDPFEVDDHRVSRKRKAVELSMGQSSSGIGSSNMFQRSESGLNLDPTIPRLGLNVGRVPSENPRAEIAHRNVSLRISSSSQQELLPDNGNDTNGRQSDVSDPYSSLRLGPNDFTYPPVAATPDNLSSRRAQQIQALIIHLQSTSRGSQSSASRPNRSSNLDSISDHSLFAPPSNVRNVEQSDVSDSYSSLRLDTNDFGSPPVAATPDNSSSDQERMPALFRRLQSTSRWSRSSASRASRSSNLDLISDHSLFAPPSNVRNGGQTGLNWIPNGGGDEAVNDGGSGGAATSQAGTSSELSPNYHPRRLSAYLRRSLLSATDVEAGGGQNSLLPRIPPVFSTASSSSSSSSLDIEIPPADYIQGHHSRSPLLVARQFEGGVAFYPSRTMAGGSERRGRLVSEIRSVLDSMRRGEALLFEDRMLLNQSLFYGIADNHDRHRDMRLDIDNMSYEELLALEERIGNVETGLTVEKILKHLKQTQYIIKTGQTDTEPCCICQEEYKDGDDLGTLECEHHFHSACIKQWLQQKNSCPICKSTGLAAAK